MEQSLESSLESSVLHYKKVHTSYRTVGHSGQDRQICSCITVIYTSYASTGEVQRRIPGSNNWTIAVNTVRTHSQRSSDTGKCDTYAQYTCKTSIR
jgi:hypothetical protein